MFLSLLPRIQNEIVNDHSLTYVSLPSSVKVTVIASISYHHSLSVTDKVIALLNHACYQSPSLTIIRRCFHYLSPEKLISKNPVRSKDLGPSSNNSSRRSGYRIPIVSVSIGKGCEENVKLFHPILPHFIFT